MSKIIFASVALLISMVVAIRPNRADAQAVLQFQQIQVAPAVAAPAQPNGGDGKIEVDAELNPAEQQFYDQYKPMLKTELAFASRACNLDKDQRKTLSEEGEKAVKQMCRDAARGRQGMAGGFLIVNGRAVRQSLVPRSVLQRQIATAVKAKLPADVADTYAQEQAKRAEFEKQTMIENTVSMIDAKVRLSGEQRDQITDSLNKTWKENDLPQPETFMFGNDFLPPVADRCVVPFLRDAQKAVWQNRNMLNTGRIIINGGGGLILQGQNGFFAPGNLQIEFEDVLDK